MSESESPSERPTEPRQTLAMRLAERNRQRALRAERLARLRPARAQPAAEGFREEPARPAERPALRPAVHPVTPPQPVAKPVAASAAAQAQAADAIDSAEALEEFLRALTGARDGAPAAPAAPPPTPAALLQFQRPQVPPGPDPEPGDLDRLTGAGPGLIWALERAGIRRLADLAPLGADDLVARLGPIGRLVPAETWLATARGATPD